jgi:hypothetical protein
MENEVTDQNVVYKGMEKRSTLPLQNPQITSAVHVHVSEMSFSVYANATHHACVFVCVCVHACKIEQSRMKCFAVKGQQPRVYQPYSEFALSFSWWWFCPAPVFVPLLPQPFRGLCSSICSMSRALGGTSTALQISSISDPFWLWVLIELDSLHRKLCLVFWCFGR